MFSPRWRKLWRDLWGHKARTALIVLSISVGVFSVGMVVNSQIILTYDLADGYAATNPASAILSCDPFNEELVEAVREMAEVEEAEGRYSVTARVQKAGSDGTRWYSLELAALGDFELSINRVSPELGAWPPAKGELILEHASLDYLEAQVGDAVVVQMPNGAQRQLRIAGVARDMAPIPPLYSFTAYGYLSLGTLEWLGEPRAFNRLYLTVAENRLDKAHVQRVAAQVREEHLEVSGHRVYLTQIAEPLEPPLNFVIVPMTMTLGLLAVFSLLLSLLLVFNTMTALVGQQIQQIGVMKAVGGSTRQITGMYLALALIYGLLALVIPLPLGALAARSFSGYWAELLNFELISRGMPARVLVLQVAVSLLGPVLAALYPIAASVRITVHEAISSHRLGKGQFGTRGIDRLVTAASQRDALGRPLLVSLRSSVRRRGRLVFTLAPLSLAGASFIAVLCVHASVLRTVDDMERYGRYDVDVQLSQAYPTAQLEQEALRVPGVVRAESWWVMMPGAVRVRADGSASEAISVLAPPAGTDLMEPLLLKGRWLLPGNEKGIVVNDYMLKAEGDIEIGDELWLRIQGRETTWDVVGIVKGVLTPEMIVYTNRRALAHALGEAGKANSVKIVTAQHDAAFQAGVEQALEAQFQGRGLYVEWTMALAETRAAVKQGLTVFILFLLGMAALVAVVGGMGLASTTSLNVLERQREIGVMRAIGASDGAVLKIVMGEAVLISAVSWLLGSALALPLGKTLSDQLGERFFQSPFSYNFSAIGVVVWLGVVVVLAAAASFLPARNASRVSVREALAYE